MRIERPRGVVRGRFGLLQILDGSGPRRAKTTTGYLGCRVATWYTRIVNGRTIGIDQRSQFRSNRLTDSKSLETLTNADLSSSATLAT
jgi:hypothetical protein